MLLQIIFFSPLLVAILAVLVVMGAKLARLQKPKATYLMGLSMQYAVIGVIASFVLMIVWMILYEKFTGYNTGNAPLGWIFFYGPLSAALGQLAALIGWWFKKPTEEDMT